MFKTYSKQSKCGSIKKQKLTTGYRNTKIKVTDTQNVITSMYVD